MSVIIYFLIENFQEFFGNDDLVYFCFKNVENFESDMCELLKFFLGETHERF